MWIMNSSLHSETNATCPAALLHCEPTLTLLPRIGQRCYDQVAFLLLPPLLPCLAANYDHEPYVFTEMTYVVTEITGHGCKRLGEMFKNRTTPQETTDFEWINMDRLTEMWDDIGIGEFTRDGQEKKMSVTNQCIVEDFDGNVKEIGAFFRHQTLPIVQFYYYNKWHKENILRALPDVSLTDTR